MKIEIDLNEILGDEYGEETIQESIRRQVTESVTEIATKGVSELINSEVSRVMGEALEKAISEKMPGIVDDLMNTEYSPVDKWGQQSKSTTFRKELLKSISENMVYRKANYDSDKNVFTRAVDEVIKQQIDSFKSEFNKKIDAQFTEDAMLYAANKLKAKLGIAY